MRVVLALLSASAPVAGQVPDAWRQWLYASPIETAGVPSVRLTSVVVAEGVASRAQPDLADLRVIDDAGREIPYVLHAKSGGRRIELQTARVLEPSFVPGKHAQIILDAGSGAAVHNSVRLHIQSADDLITWVEIAVSDDASDWRVVRERGSIFILRQEGRGEKTAVSYADSPARYVRARVLEDPARYSLTGAEIGFERSRSGESVAVGLPLVRRTDVPRRSVWQSPAGPPRSISEIRFETAQKAFVRPVTVEWSDDGKVWRRAGAGEISRTVEGGQPRESLSVAFEERRAAEWRISVHDGNDTAVPDLVPAAFATPRRVVFNQEPGRRYTLIYGHARASAPQYDLSRLTDEAVLDAAVDAGLGPAITNANYSDPAPWTEQNPIVVWVALLVAVAVLGWLAVRALKSAA
jgi:hypothetical protein